MTAPSNDDDRSLFTLIGELPDTISSLVRAEIDQIKAEVSYKVKHFGIGSGLVAGAAVVGIFLLFTLIITGIFALALVMPAWAAALTVSGALLLIIVILLWIAYINFKRGAEPLESIDSLKADLDALKGTGDYDRRY
ncbi:phage holin family protein [Agromyces badenianii]|uniref:Phage holin family protein n=1 Tax=Agromyces badenianii TaxID=2080742 RepID=A0A2S0WSZ4_9MICO|nr:phage holin family protein [Agromyces badenianii]AWB94364.1 phage holin family protein [Agromyces badenianii]PWC05728.1 phage holin family protein [Agromyces badenianii]